MRLDLRSIAYGCGSKQVGQDVTLSLSEGEVLALLGGNGAGKTTLFKTMLGLLPVKAGDILLDDRPISGWSRRERALRIAYVPQAHAASFPFPVRDVVMMGRTAHIAPFSMPTRHDTAIAEAALESLGILRLADAPYTEISGGERQLTLIARAIAQQARIVVMDEPTANLDYGNQLRLLEHIRQLAARGPSIVLSTHNPDHALQAADRVALLKGGTLVAVGTPGAVLTPQALKDIYGIDVVIGAVEGSEARVCAPLLLQIPA
jgi:iron complex transport system ATP-binding protein